MGTQEHTSAAQQSLKIMYSKAVRKIQQIILTELTKVCHMPVLVADQPIEMLHALQGALNGWVIVEFYRCEGSILGLDALLNKEDGMMWPLPPLFGLASLNKPHKLLDFYDKLPDHRMVHCDNVLTAYARTSSEEMAKYIQNNLTDLISASNKSRWKTTEEQIRLTDICNNNYLKDSSRPIPVLVRAPVTRRTCKGALLWFLYPWSKHIPLVVQRREGVYDDSVILLYEPTRLVAQLCDLFWEPILRPLIEVDKVALPILHAYIYFIARTVSHLNNDLGSQYHSFGIIVIMSALMTQIESVRQDMKHKMIDAVLDTGTDVYRLIRDYNLMTFDLGYAEQYAFQPTDTNPADLRITEEYHWAFDAAAGAGMV
jgi:hypothetical protein